MSFTKNSLTQQYISTITQSQQPQKLYKLNCTSKNIHKLDSSIKKYNKIRCLILDFNYLQKIQNLNPLFDLRELHVEGNMITKIQGLQTCKNLTVLNLSSNQIERIEKISHLTKLEHLNLSKNKLQKIAILETFKDLKILNLASNYIRSLDSLPAFSKLQTLMINDNQIQKISMNAFANSMKLNRLNLANNRLSEAFFVSKLINLQYLNLSHNLITSFNLECPLKYLQELLLNHNELDRLPAVGQYFPELVILNLSHNMFCSQHQFITFLSDNQMLTEIYFTENPIHSKSFEQTLYHLYKFDRINSNTYNEPGTKYLQSINKLQADFKKQFNDLEDDEEDRKLKMSGFYNDDLENRMTGIKPHRAVSPATKKAKAIVNDNLNQIEKSFKEFVENDRRIKSLRQIYQKICEQNNIQKPKIQHLRTEDGENVYLTEQISQRVLMSNQEQRLSELRLRNDNNQKVMNETKKQKQSKWAELKAKTKEKSFNIRKSRTKDNSLSKVSTELGREKVSSQLMKTQTNPPRPSFGSTILQPAIKSGKMFYRPTSQKKLSKNL